MSNINNDQLKYLQSLDIGRKTARSVVMMQKFHNEYGGYVSLSGGKGSTVLADINKRFNIGMQCATVASAEPVENLKVCLGFDSNFIHATTNRKEVFTRYGYPIVSKEVAMSVSRYHTTKRQDQKDYRLNGRTVDGKKQTAGVIPKKLAYLIYAPFELSEKCCDITKKQPLKKFAKQNGLLPVTGEMASESKNRERKYKQHGCIQEGKKCTPLGFWTDADLDEYISIYNVTISTLYQGERQRTGCAECMFGMAYDKDRFERIKATNPNTYNHLMGGGQWIEKDRYRLVKETRMSEAKLSNLYWVPSKEGYGFQFILDYMAH